MTRLIQVQDERTKTGENRCLYPKVPTLPGSDAGFTPARSAERRIFNLAGEVGSRSC